MAMFVYLHSVRHISPPAKGQVAQTSARGNSDTQPNVECHKYEHEEIADHDLNHVQERLQKVHARAESSAGGQRKQRLNVKQVSHSHVCSNIKLKNCAIYFRLRM